MYAKFISRTKLDYAPKTITKGNVHYNPYPVELMIEDGYKEVIESEMPIRTGYYYTPYYEETETVINQKWDEHEEPIPEPSVEDRLDQMDAQVLYTAVMTDTLIEED